MKTPKRYKVKPPNKSNWQEEAIFYAKQKYPEWITSRNATDHYDYQMSVTFARLHRQGRFERRKPEGAYYHEYRYKEDKMVPNNKYPTGNGQTVASLISYLDDHGEQFGVDIIRGTGYASAATILSREAQKENSGIYRRKKLDPRDERIKYAYDTRPYEDDIAIENLPMNKVTISQCQERIEYWNGILNIKLSELREIL